MAKPFVPGSGAGVGVWRGLSLGLDLGLWLGLGLDLRLELELGLGRFMPEKVWGWCSISILEGFRVGVGTTVGIKVGESWGWKVWVRATVGGKLG